MSKHPAQSKSNPLLIKNEVGKGKISAYNLPSEKNDNHVYGRPKIRDPEGANLVSSSWNFHQQPSEPIGARDFKKLNMIGLKQGITKPKEVYDFRRDNDARIVVKGPTLNRQIYLPEQEHRYGVRTKPHTPMEEIMNNKFGNEAEIKLGNIYQLIHAEKEKYSNQNQQNQINNTGNKKNKNNNQLQSNQVQNQNEGPFKLQKFQKAKSKMSQNQDNVNQQNKKNTCIQEQSQPKAQSQKNVNVQEALISLINRIRSNCLSLGKYGVRDLCCALKEADSNQSQILDIQDFSQILIDNGIDISMDDLRTIFKVFDKKGNRMINYMEFMTFIIGEPSEQRLRKIQQSFQSLDKNSRGRITLQDLKAAQNIKNNPEINFEEFLSKWKDLLQDGYIYQDQFEQFYKELSINIQDEMNFDSIVARG